MSKNLTIMSGPDGVADTDLITKRQVVHQFKVHAGTGANDLSTVYPQGVQSTAASSLASRAGQAVFLPIQLHAGTYDAFVPSVTVAQVAGTTTFTMALYAENSDGFPDITGVGVLMSATLALTSTGATPVAAGASVTLPDGRYWLCSLYVRTVNPTTEPQLHCVSNNAYSFPSKSYQAPNACRAWGLGTTLTALPSTALDGSNRVVIGTNDAVCMGVRRSA